MERQVQPTEDPAIDRLQLGTATCASPAAWQAAQQLPSWAGSPSKAISLLLQLSAAVVCLNASLVADSDWPCSCRKQVGAAFSKDDPTPGIFQNNAEELTPEEELAGELAGGCSLTRQSQLPRGCSRVVWQTSGGLGWQCHQLPESVCRQVVQEPAKSYCSC